MGSLSNGKLCNGVSNKRHFDEIHCASSSTAKFKKRKVSAVRVFPPGCGPNAPRIKTNPVDDEKKTDIPVVSASASENGDEPLSREEVKSPSELEMRKVSAVRVFPPGCGPNASRIKTKPVDDEKKTDIPVVSASASENGDEPLSREEVKSPSELEMFGSLDDLVGKVVASAAGTVNGDDVASSIKPLGDDFWQTLQIDAPEFSHDFDIVEEPPAVAKIDDTVETKLEVKINTLANEGGPPSIKNSSLANDSPISDGNMVKCPNVETKYPRRRVSATREFPPFCGRNAPCPTEEERAKINFGASGKAPERCAELLESEIVTVKKDESEAADVKDENYKIEDIKKAVPEVKIETSYADEQGGPSVAIVRDEVDASPVTETKGSVFEESDGKVRESDFQKGKQKAHLLERKTKATTVDQAEYKDERDIQENVSKEIVVYADKSLDISHSDGYALGCDDDGTMVQGLIEGPSSPLRHDHNHAFREEKMKYNSRAKVDKGDNVGVGTSEKTLSGNIVIRKKSDNLVVSSPKKRSPSSTKIAVKKKVLVSKEEDEISHLGRKEKEFELTLPPFGPSSSSEGSMRNKVRETLRLFQAICRKILQGEESSSKQQGKKRIDLEAAKIIKAKGKEVNTVKQIIGAVPGVEVGDEFLYRVELALVGVHRLYQAGIDYMMNNGMIVCVSIVASGGYADELDNPDILIYSGQGGMPGGKNKEKQAEDQKLERGNLSMKNSIMVKNPVRVIRGTKEKVTRSDARTKMVPSYAYDGLYTVEKYWQEVGHNGKLVFKFELRRIPGQPELAWKEVKQSKKFKSREGVCVDDISNGKEVFRICAVNNVDNERPPNFNYITKTIYPSWYSPTPPDGCDCVDGCSDSRKCSCVVKNGEEIPYNHNGAIVEAKPLVHECGPSCKCPPSCYNRVTQHGMKIQLEIFKTGSRGWGVRSLSSIPSGSFICEYIGELLEDKEAEQRRNDEYLFDIGKNFTDCSHQLYSETSLAEVAEDSGFTIDAAVYGNVGRFINHSCSPNLYAQNVMYDHEDRSMPHIMFFAAENIPPLQELTYHYNYSVGQVRDSNGNVKRKSCYCGSEECTGRMY